METYSFIDFGLRDFLRYPDGRVITIVVSGYEEVEDWLLSHGEEYGWTNQGTRNFCWEDEE